LLTVMFDPAILREVLPEFLLSTRDRQTLGTEDDGAGTGSALIDGQQVLRHARFLVVIAAFAAVDRKINHFVCNLSRVSGFADSSENTPGMLGQGLGRKLQLQPAPAATDMNGGMQARRVVDKGAQALLLPQRADAADQIAGGPLRCRRVGHISLLRSGCRRQRLE